MDHCKHITITPINKSLKSKSNIDFNEQCVRTLSGELKWCWDDSKYNDAKVGEYFAFMFYGKKVILHKIIAIKPPTERLESWSSNVGQNNRNVLELSDPLYYVSWEQWMELQGPTCHMCTYTTVDLSISRYDLYSFLCKL